MGQTAFVEDDSYQRDFDFFFPNNHSAKLSIPCYNKNGFFL